MTKKKIPLFDSTLVKEALVESFRKLSPKVQLRNPVMFLVYLGSIFTTVLFIAASMGLYSESVVLTGMTAFWLWVTVLFANFAEALAEGRARAQASALKGLKKVCQPL